MIRTVTVANRRKYTPDNRMRDNLKLKITNRIIVCGKYLNELKLLAELEHDRIFCRHNIEHFLNVALNNAYNVQSKEGLADPDVVLQQPCL